MLKNFRCIHLLFSEEEKSPYYIYFKAHKVNDGDNLGLVDGRTIFVTNIPSFLSNVQLNFIFEKLGKINRTIRWNDKDDLAFITMLPELYEYKPEGAKHAYILFENEIKIGKLDKFLNNFPMKLYELFDKFEVKVSEEPINCDEILPLLNTYMVEHSNKKDQQKDGWITVNKINKLPLLKPNNQDNQWNNDKKDNFDLYDFKRKLKYKEQISNLRRKFEEDRARVADMKRKRVFKPLTH